MTPAIAVALDALREAQADAPEELLRLLRRGEVEMFASHDAIGCIECGAMTPYQRLVTGPANAAPHTRECRLAHWLRVFGGQAEVQRQVDAAHEAAVYLGYAEPRTQSAGLRITGIDRDARSITFDSSQVRAGDSFTIDGVTFVASTMARSLEAVQFSESQLIEAAQPRSRVPPAVAKATQRRQRKERRR